MLQDGSNCSSQNWLTPAWINVKPLSCKRGFVALSIDGPSVSRAAPRSMPCLFNALYKLVVFSDCPCPYPYSICTLTDWITSLSYEGRCPQYTMTFRQLRLMWTMDIKPTFRHVGLSPRNYHTAIKWIDFCGSPSLLSHAKNVDLFELYISCFIRYYQRTTSV